MIPHSEKNALPRCGLCGKIAYHIIGNEEQQAAYLCCYHNRKLFFRMGEQCHHNEYAAVIGPLEKIRGYNVQVIYRILPKGEWKIKRDMILKIICTAPMKTIQ